MTDHHPDSILRHRPFVLFWCARVCAAVGYQMLAVAIGWQLYELTGNPLDLGLVGLVQFVPAVALVLVIGQVADRQDRRKVLMACQAIEAAAAASLLAAVLLGAISRELILGIAFFMGIARAFELTVMQIRSLTAATADALALQTSLSWRVTAPLRRIRAAFRRDSSRGRRDGATTR